MPSPDASRERSTLERLLGVFTDVRSGEGWGVALMTLNVFLLLTAYYILKTVREPLILRGGMLGLSGEEVKVYAAAGQALLLLLVVPAYGWLANRGTRIRLMNTSLAVFIACLLIFNVLAGLDVPLGLVFFLWLGIFNVFVIAQFWSYANDIYSEEQGKRLFAMIAVGGSLGAWFGPTLARYSSDNLYVLMLIAAGLLTACGALYNVVERMIANAEVEQSSAKTSPAPLSKRGGFQLLFSSRYLLAIALMLLIANLVNTTGEFILARSVNEYAELQVPGTADASAAALEQLQDERKVLIKNFYATFYGTVNLLGFLIQAFLVSRIFKYLGVRVALFILPIVAFGGYAVIGLLGGLVVTRISKIAENSTDYSLQNTVRQSLFLLTTRAEKYKAKAAIDTFFVRAGDTLSAVLVGLGLHGLGFGVQEFAFTNVVLIGGWLLVALVIAREHRDLESRQDQAVETGEQRAVGGG